MTANPTNSKETRRIAAPKPRIPSEAEAEIMALLAQDMRISADDIARILKKHSVGGNADALQYAYRRRIGQRLMASIRDEEGRRELLASRRENGGMEYVVIGCCNDPRKLKAIRNRLLGSMAGLDVSARKVRARIGFLERIITSVSSRHRKRKGKRSDNGIF